MTGFGYFIFGLAAALATGFILAKVRPTGALLLLLTLSPLYTSAALIFFYPHFQNRKAVELYPAGLLLAFMWQQAWPLADRIPSEWLKKWMPAVVWTALALVTIGLAVHAYFSSIE